MDSYTHEIYDGEYNKDKRVRMEYDVNLLQINLTISETLEDIEVDPD